MQIHVLEGIPANYGASRDKWILDAVAEGRAEFEFSPVYSSYNGHSATFFVFRDALKIDGVRILVSARLAQQIADMLDCSLLTPKLADLLFEQRSVTLKPLPRQPVVADTKTMIAQSQRIDDAISAAGGDTGGIIQSVGKHWVLVNKIKGTAKAANYGWHFEGSSFGGQKFEPTVSLPGVRLIQGVGTRHDASHVDYSQNLVLVSNEVEVDGQTMSLRDVLQDPEYAGLASHEGVLHVLAQPGAGTYSPSSGSNGADRPSNWSDHGGTEGEKDRSDGTTGDVPASSSNSGLSTLFKVSTIFGGIALGVWGYSKFARRTLWN